MICKQCQTAEKPSHVIQTTTYQAGVYYEDGTITKQVLWREGICMNGHRIIDLKEINVTEENLLK